MSIFEDDLMSYFKGDSLISVFEGSLDIYPVTLVLQQLFSTNYNRTVAVSILLFFTLGNILLCTV